MAEATPIRVPRVRFTKLTACGAYDTTACAMWATKGIVEIELKEEGRDREAVPLENADGEVLGVESLPPVLHWYTVTMKMTGIEPTYFSWLSGQAIRYNNATPPVAIGLTSGANSSALGSVAVEGWTRLVGRSCAAGVPQYGYILLPWLLDGKFTDITFNSGLTECTLTARTAMPSAWSTGPYSVHLSEAAATLGQPWPLFTAVGAEDHRIWDVTKLAPPIVTTTCGPVVGSLTVIDDDGAGAGLAATATLPTGAGAAPGYINWGDSTPIALIAAGSLTATHTYALAGTYTVTWKPSGQSGPTYVGSVTMA